MCPRLCSMGFSSTASTAKAIPSLHSCRNGVSLSPAAADWSVCPGSWAGMLRVPEDGRLQR